MHERQDMWESETEEMEGLSFVSSSEVKVEKNKWESLKEVI